MTKTDSSALSRWRTARRITLGAIVIAGTMATAAAVTHRMAEHPCARSHAKTPHQYTYSGIGVELTEDEGRFIVRRVFEGTPADGKLYPNAILVSVNGEKPEDLPGWTKRIRGQQGTEVELEIASPCSGATETVVLTRDVIRLQLRH